MYVGHNLSLTTHSLSKSAQSFGPTYSLIANVRFGVVFPRALMGVARITLSDKLCSVGERVSYLCILTNVVVIS